MLDVDSDKEDFEESKVIFTRENDSDMDASRDFFEIPNDNEISESVIFTVFSYMHLLCYCSFTVVFF